MQAQPIEGFVVLESRYIRLIATYVDPDENAPVPNHAYQRRISEELCYISNTIKALPLPSDVLSVKMDGGEQIRCVVRHRYFITTHVEFYALHGITPALVIMVVVDGGLPG
jgi:hypothetical protein